MNNKQGKNKSHNNKLEGKYTKESKEANLKPLNPGMVNEYDEFAKDLSPDDFE
jgi:hypothetical protein